MARTATHRRDLAEAFELGFVSRFVAPSSTVLDVGCGKGARLAFTLAEYPKRAPHRYLGLETVDLVKAFPDVPTWATFDGGSDLVNVLGTLGESFSVIRFAGFGAISGGKGRIAKAVAAIVDRLADGGVALLGFAGDGAVSIEEAAAALEKAGAEVTRVVGVRADDPARLKAELDTEGRKYHRTLVELFPAEVAGAFLAATEPDAATLRYAVVRKRDEAPPPPIRNSPGRKKTEEPAAEKAPRAAKPTRAVVPPTSEEETKPRATKRATPSTPTRAPAGPATGTTFKVGKMAFPAGSGFELTAAMLATGRFTRAEILEARRAAFPNRRPQLSDIKFVERELVKKGVAFPAPKE